VQTYSSKTVAAECYRRSQHVIFTSDCCRHRLCNFYIHKNCKIWQNLRGLLALCALEPLIRSSA